MYAGSAGSSESSSVRGTPAARAAGSLAGAATPGGAVHHDTTTGRAYAQVGNDHAPGRMARRRAFLRRLVQLDELDGQGFDVSSALTFHRELRAAFLAMGVRW